VPRPASLKTPRLRVIAPVLVAAAALLAFLPVLDNGFVNWDDPVFLTDNPLYRGLSPHHVFWMFTNLLQESYQPLAWLTLGLDFKLWGMEAAGYHLTSLLWHVADSVLFFLVARRVLALARGERSASLDAGALLAALLFAVHPLRTEAIAWASERRELVGDFFWLLGVHVYLRAGAKRERTSGPVAACLVLALFAKGTMLSLPLVLLALDDYPLKRISSPRDFVRRALEKWPLFALDAVFGLVGVWGAARAGEDALKVETWTLGQRAAQVAYGLGFYARKTVWPSSLAYLYEMRSNFDPLSPGVVLGGGAAALAAAAAWRYRRRFPAGLAAAAAYAAALLPVLGFMKYGAHLVADRYANLSCLPLALLAGGGFAALLSRARPAARAAAWAAALAVVLALGTLARAQAATWRDSVTLWSRALEIDPENSQAHANLGVAAAEAGDSARAEDELKRATELEPLSNVIAEDYGAYLTRSGRWRDAAAVFDAWTARRPRLARAHARLALALARSGERSRARSEYRAALALAPGDAEVHHDFGVLLMELGRNDEARSEFEAAVALDPGRADAQINLGLLLAASGRRADAYPHFRAALATNEAAQRALAHFNWGNALSEDSRLDEAARHYREAVRLSPGLLDARFNLGNTLARLGRYDEAAREYRALLALAPSDVQARANLAAVRRLSVKRRAD